MKILIIGNGGREHSIAWKAAQNQDVEKIYVAPGNGGTLDEAKCKNINITDYNELLNFAKEKQIDITIVGGEKPLTDGIVDLFNSNGLKIFGPDSECAKLEGSKAYSKDFMKKYGVKTADYAVLEDSKKALEYLKAAKYPTVIKADGLAAGKGVIIANDYQEAEDAVNQLMVQDIFKGSGKKIVIEEFLEGVEASILSVCDGETIIPFMSAKDHKKIFDKDMGPNTGGMGSICPNPVCTPEVLKEFNDNILVPTLNGIKGEKLNFCGVIFFGIIITKKGVYLLEYNVRLGDPETESVLPMMENDFVDLIIKCMDKKLRDTKLTWKPGYSACVIASSGGYPGSYETGYKISGLDKVKGKVFIAGANYRDDDLLTSGGRVLGVTCYGETLDEALNKSYEDMKKVKFEGIYYRNDIGR